MTIEQALELIIRSAKDYKMTAIELSDLESEVEAILKGLYNKARYSD